MQFTSLTPVDIEFIEEGGWADMEEFLADAGYDTASDIDNTYAVDDGFDIEVIDEASPAGEVKLLTIVGGRFYEAKAPAYTLASHPGLWVKSDDYYESA